MRALAGASKILHTDCEYFLQILRKISGHGWKYSGRRIRRWDRSSCAALAARL